HMSALPDYVRGTVGGNQARGSVAVFVGGPTESNEDVRGGGGIQFCFFEQKSSGHRFTTENDAREFPALKETNNAADNRLLVIDNVNRDRTAVTHQKNVPAFGLTREFARRVETGFLKRFSQVYAPADRREPMVGHDQHVGGIAKALSFECL